MRNLKNLTILSVFLAWRLPIAHIQQFTSTCWFFDLPEIIFLVFLRWLILSYLDFPFFLPSTPRRCLGEQVLSIDSEFHSEPDYVPDKERQLRSLKKMTWDSWDFWSVNLFRTPVNLFSYRVNLFQVYSTAYLQQRVLSTVGYLYVVSSIFVRYSFVITLPTT